MWSAAGSEAPRRFEAENMSRKIFVSHKAVSSLRFATALHSLTVL